jgi:hypothetical protein
MNENPSRVLEHGFYRPRDTKKKAMVSKKLGLKAVVYREVLQSGAIALTCTYPAANLHDCIP